MRRLSWAMAILILAYGAILAGSALSLLACRGWALAQLTTESAQRDWQSWRDAAAAQDGLDGPVARRPVKSDEPPTLVLLRDHLAAVIGGVWIFTSALFAFFAFVVRGIWRELHSASAASVSIPRSDVS